VKYPFNVRVYGILINEDNQLLVSDEEEYGIRFIKLPGGGLEYGEGLRDGLKREFMEECFVEVEVGDHFYTTDFFNKSAFGDNQVISVYYYVRALDELKLSFKSRQYDFDTTGDVMQAFRWVHLDQLTPNEFTFPTDKRVAELLMKKWREA
jgi:ADP-ribose pyrophosphatase YjhB (NUDIX family)